MLWAMPQALEAMDIRLCELGASGEHHKAPFANRTRDPLSGRAPPAAGLAARLAGVPVIGRLDRRLDQIAASELGAYGRAVGVVRMVTDLKRRAASRRDHAA